MSHSYLLSIFDRLHPSTPYVSPFTRSNFLQTYLKNQPFSFPDSIMYYIAKNPSSAKVYRALVNLCKYFFVQNGIIVIARLNFYHGEKPGWKTSFNSCFPVDVTKLSCKLCIMAKISMTCRMSYGQGGSHLISSIIPKIYRSEILNLALLAQHLSFNDFGFLASKCETIWVSRIRVSNENGCIIPLEKLVEAAPKLKKFTFVFNKTAENSITTKTAQELIQLPHFAKLNLFYLENIPEIFDMHTFFNFVKRNKKTSITLRFREPCSEESRNELQTIVNKIVASEKHSYKVPLIYFFNQDVSAHMKLFCLFHKLK